MGIGVIFVINIIVVEMGLGMHREGSSRIKILKKDRLLKRLDSKRTTSHIDMNLLRDSKKTMTLTMRKKKKNLTQIKNTCKNYQQNQ